MNVANILRLKGHDVETAGADAPLAQIIQKLTERGIGAIVICDRPNRVAGIISERDIVRALARSGTDALTAPAADHMTRAVQTCGTATTVEECMSIMTAGRFRHLPVVERGELVGIVSIGDVVKERIAEAEHEAEAMRNYIVAS